MTDKTFLLSCQAGIKKDGTDFSSRNWIDGRWVRFQRGLPRKMGGYRHLITMPRPDAPLEDTPNVPRTVFVVPNSPNFNVYVADFASVKYFTINQQGSVIGGITNRTPASFPANLNNLWCFDTMYSATTNASTLIAHAAPNLASIDSPVEGAIYYGDTRQTAALTDTGISVSGGIVVLHPFLFMFGNDGDMKWSRPNDPTNVLGDARVTGAKIVAGLPTRGGNTSPAGIFWSLDSVIRATQVGTSDIEFRFDTVTDESSILSSKSVIEYDGLFYWIGIDKFLVYNGTVQEVPNNMSTNFFFDNLNYSQRQKVWATKVTHFGEIWWYFPFGNSVECNWVLIHNIREKTWYDTPLDRSAGFYSQVFSKPIWADNTGMVDPAHPELPPRYSVWIHETGLNKVAPSESDPFNPDFHVATPIQSYIESSIFSLASFGIDEQFVGISKNTIPKTIEPDFDQTGEVSVTIRKRAYARSPVVDSIPYPFSPTTEKIDTEKEEAREISLKFESNVLDGFYEMGNILVTLKPGSDRPL